MFIIPLPNNYKQKEGNFIIETKTTFNSSNEFKISSEYFLDYINSFGNLKLEVSLNSNINFLLNPDIPNEGYIIDINENYLNIHARTDQGCFYAIQSLKQMITLDNKNLKISCIYIEDYPRFSYRSFMIDVVRHFFKKDVILKLIDYLAFHKLNHLHLHLSDDQGFRIQIDKYPLLTKIASKRSKTIKQGNPTKHETIEGYYTKEDIKEIVAYAKSRFIEVIPEIDLPGHSTAILAAYPHLSCHKEPLEVESKYGILKNSVCASNDEVYNFIYDVLDELMEMFDSKFIHIGGDEIRFRNWKNCISCKNLMKKENLKSYKDLSRYFTNKVASYLREKNRTPIVWNDLINKKSNYNIILQHWTPYKKKESIKEINDDRLAIISNFFYLYLNYPYSMTPLKKTYNFEPIMKGINYPDNVIGIEATLWTEYIYSLNMIQEHIFPRLAAVSEIAWTNPDNKNYDQFLIRLKHLLKLYDKKLINYKLDYNKHESLVKRINKTVKWFKLQFKNEK